MKIDASAVTMQGSSSYQKTEETSVETSFIRVGAIMPWEELQRDGVTLEISDEGREQAQTASIKKVTKPPDMGRDWETNIKRMILEAFLRAIGKQSMFSDIGKLTETLNERLKEMDTIPNEDGLEQQLLEQAQTAAMPKRNAASRMVRVSFEQSSFKLSRSTEIQNSMQFSAQGAIRTEDGREINFGLEINMSQSFVEKTDFEAVFQKLDINPTFCDPLVVNFNSSSADLQDMKFSFDLDADGDSDQISRIMSGSGLLALDTYDDGVIHDGNQLFGTHSGNGFADLALHDGDSNGWIDENDEVFDKLRVWVQGEDGSNKLIALGQLGIGAIYLGNVNTDYCLGNLNSPDGMVRKTGVFLYEDGRAGTIQHIDLAV